MPPDKESGRGIQTQSSIAQVTYFEGGFGRKGKPSVTRGGGGARTQRGPLAPVCDVEDCDSKGSGNDIGPSNDLAATSLGRPNSEPEPCHSQGSVEARRPKLVQPTISFTAVIKPGDKVSPKIVTDDQIIGHLKRKRGPKMQ